MMQYLTIGLCLFAVTLQCHGSMDDWWSSGAEKRELDMSVIGASCENAMDVAIVGKYFGGVIEGKFDNVSSEKKKHYLHGLKCAVERLLGRLGIDVHEFEEIREEHTPEDTKRRQAKSVMKLRGAMNGLDADAIFASCDGPNTLAPQIIGRYLAGVVEGKHDDADASHKNAFLHGLRCAIEKLMVRLGIELEDF